MLFFYIHCVYFKYYSHNMKTINSIRINYQIDIKNYQIDIKNYQIDIKNYQIDIKNYQIELRQKRTRKNQSEPDKLYC